MKFAKVFNVTDKEEQFLFYIDVGDDNRLEVLHQMIRFSNGLLLDAKMGGLLPEDADKALEKIDQEYADSLYKKIMAGLDILDQHIEKVNNPSELLDGADEIEIAECNFLDDMKNEKEEEDKNVY